jgi:NAD(P)-dependent dehydrogenase (short-subunit alcohol dehydrogenase family)
MRIPAALATAAGAAALAAGWHRHQRADDIRGEVAVVTGASRGLGLLLAAEPGRRGAGHAGQGHGRIVSIASIGGQVSVPHLLPYCTAKFAGWASPRACAPSWARAR